MKDGLCARMLSREPCRRNPYCAAATVSAPSGWVEMVRARVQPREPCRRNPYCAAATVSALSGWVEMVRARVRPVVLGPRS